MTMSFQNGTAMTKLSCPRTIFSFWTLFLIQSSFVMITTILASPLRKLVFTCPTIEVQLSSEHWISKRSSSKTTNFMSNTRALWMTCLAKIMQQECPNHSWTIKMFICGLYLTMGCTTLRRKSWEWSLNNAFLQSPDVTNSLIGVLTRFRQESVAMIADVEAMSYQVRDLMKRTLLRFLWSPEKM